MFFFFCSSYFEFSKARARKCNKMLGGVGAGGFGVGCFDVEGGFGVGSGGFGVGDLGVGG